MADVTVKQKEAKTVRFTVTDADGSAVDLSTSTLQFDIKRHKRDTTALVTKADAVFDKTSAALGIVTVPLSETDLDQAYGDYVGELKIVFSGSNIDKSADISIEIQKAVIN